VEEDERPKHLERGLRAKGRNTYKISVLSSPLSPRESSPLTAHYHIYWRVLFPGPTIPLSDISIVKTAPHQDISAIDHDIGNNASTHRKQEGSLHIRLSCIITVETL
jgi:hypothetical protein